MTRPPSESPGTPRLAWSAAFILAAGLAAIAVAAPRIAARWGTIPAAAAAGLAALALLLTLIGILVRQRAWRTAASAATAESADLAGELQQAHAQLSQRVAENQQLQAQLHRCVSELEQREDQRRADAAARSAALEKAVDQLVRIQLPLAFSGSAVPPVEGDAAGGDSEVAALSGHVLAAVASGTAQLHQELDEERETARLAVVSLARRVQASAHRIQEEATRMAQRHPADPDVLETSMRVDHAAAQQARHAQSMAVLSGEWPGQQWVEPLALVDVARAAASRIVPYQRVSVSGDQDVAAVARVAEPLIHLVAELLANATQSSPPASQVLVTVRSVQRGAVIEIDDGGVGMDEHRLEQAREIASGRRPASLTTLGEIPQTGLAVVGQYARRHGFGVDLVPSPYGGIRAVALVPAELVEVLDPAGTVPVRQPALPAPAREPAVPPAAAREAVLPPSAAARESVLLPADSPEVPAPAAAADGESALPEPSGTPVSPAAPAGPPAIPAEPAGTPAPAAASTVPMPAEPAVPPARAAADPLAPAASAGGQPPASLASQAPAAAEPSAPAARPAGNGGGRHAGREVTAVPRSRRPAEESQAGAAETDDDPLTAEVTAAGLPRRRSRRGEAVWAATQSLTPMPLPAPPAPDPAPAPSPAEAGAWMGAFLGGARPAGTSPAGGDGSRRRQHED